MPAVLVIIIGILFIGSVAAVWWWSISAKASPYADEALRRRSKSEEARKREQDATVVKKLQDAGAVLVAKTAVGALAMGDIWFGGVTKNPWKLDQGSSGSSAGSASGTVAALFGFSIGQGFTRIVARLGRRDRLAHRVGINAALWSQNREPLH